MNKALETTWGVLVALFMLFSALLTPLVAVVLAAAVVLGVVGNSRIRRDHRGGQVQ